MKAKIISTSATERSPRGWLAQIYADIGGLTFRWTCGHNHQKNSTAAECAKKTATKIEENEDE